MAVGSLGHFDQESTNGSKRGEREMHHLLRGKRPFNPVVRRENDDPILVQPVSQTFFKVKRFFKSFNIQLIFANPPRATRASMDHLFRGKRRYQDAASHFLRGRKSGSDMNHLIRGRRFDENDFLTEMMMTQQDYNMDAAADY